MRVAGRRYRDEWIPNFYPARHVGEHRVRVSRSGRLMVLDEAEDRQLSEISMVDELFGRLERSGHIVTAANGSRVIDEQARWFKGTYAGPQLHIIVATKRCNLACTYCHMLPESVKADKQVFDLQLDTAEEIVRFILATPNDRCAIEFQGGEPFLNFAAIKHVVEYATELNKSVGKNLDFSVVSNLLVCHDSELEYCRDQNINVSYSLNGPSHLHDVFRVTPTGGGSFNQVFRRIQDIRTKYPGLLSTSPLCVIGQDNVAQMIPSIDFFHENGFDGVAILKLRHLGKAREDRMPFEFDHFISHYLAALDYIMERNIHDGWNFSERMVRVVLSKIFGDFDVGFVDWRNPCGDVSCTLTYDYDGEILPSDEARSLREHFTLGNVRDTSYSALVSSPATFTTMNLSLRDRDAACRECGYNPYCGVQPILDFARTGDPTPRPHESEECRFTLAVLDWAIGWLMKEPLALLAMLPTSGRWIASQIGDGSAIAAT